MKGFYKNLCDNVAEVFVEALHLRRTQGTVDADGKGLGMLQAHVEGLDGLTLFNALILSLLLYWSRK